MENAQAHVVDGSNGLLLEVDGQIVPNYDATFRPIEEGEVVTGHVVRIDHDCQRGVRSGRANQPGAHLIDREPQIGHRIEIQVLEGADCPHQRPQNRQVLELRRNAQFNGAFAALLVLDGLRSNGHRASQHCLTDITLALQLVSHDRRRVFRVPWIRAGRRKSSARAAFGALP